MGMGRNGGRRRCCLQLHWPRFPQLEGLSHMEQKIPGLKSGQSVHIILMAGSQKRQREKLPDGFYEQYKLQTILSSPGKSFETAVWKHMGNVV